MFNLLLLHVEVVGFVQKVSLQVDQLIIHLVESLIVRMKAIFEVVKLLSDDFVGEGIIYYGSLLLLPKLLRCF
jgi:hypothetical protein